MFGMPMNYFGPSVEIFEDMFGSRLSMQQLKLRESVKNREKCGQSYEEVMCWTDN